MAAVRRGPEPPPLRVLARRHPPRANVRGTSASDDLDGRRAHDSRRAKAIDTTRLVLQRLNIDRAMIVGHSMGGMLAARFATQYPAMVERLVLYNPIGLTDPRFDRPWDSTDEGYKRTLGSTFQTVRAALMRYVAHNPAAWTPDFERYARIRYSWTLSADWPRLAMVQTIIGQVQYADPVVYDWAHIKAPTLVFGGAEDTLPGSAAVFRERMKYVAETIPGGNGKLQLIPGLGHVPHMEAPEKTYPPLVAFLREGLK